jgi:hypothetical protein
LSSRSTLYWIWASVMLATRLENNLAIIAWRWRLQQPNHCN